MARSRYIWEQRKIDITHSELIPIKLKQMLIMSICIFLLYTSAFINIYKCLVKGIIT